jgi:F-type H+-transporting ATPase subunit delta
MQQSRVAVRYATALFNEALHTQTLEEVITDIRGLQTMLKESRDLRLLFESPIIKSSQKERVLKAFFEKAKFSGVVEQFLLLLVEKSRENEIVPILQSFETLYNAHKSLVPVEIVSAFPLDADQQTTLLSKIERLTGKKPLPTYRINTALIGGFVVKIGDQVMDGSIRHQLELLRKQLYAGARSNGARNN